MALGWGFRVAGHGGAARRDALGMVVQGGDAADGPRVACGPKSSCGVGVGLRFACPDAKSQKKSRAGRSGGSMRRLQLQTLSPPQPPRALIPPCGACGEKLGKKNP